MYVICKNFVSLGLPNVIDQMNKKTFLIYPPALRASFLIDGSLMPGGFFI